MSFANTNPRTGVRYTCYQMNRDLESDVWDMVYNDGTSLDYEEWRADMLKQIAYSLNSLPEGVHIDRDQIAQYIMSENENYMDPPMFEEERWCGSSEGVAWQVFWLGGAPHLLVTESPYFGVGSACSPCVPNALDGGSVTSVWMDETAAYANAQDGQVTGYALPGTWLRDSDD